MKLKDYINYNVHVLLNSKFYLLFQVMFVFLIYYVYYTSNYSIIAFCMLTDIPEIAEEKTLASTKSIHTIINSYIEPAREIEQLTNALTQEKARSTNYYDAAGRFQSDYYNQKLINEELKSENKFLLNKYESMAESFDRRRAEVDSTLAAAKKQYKEYEDLIDKLTRKINRQKLLIRELRAQMADMPTVVNQIIVSEPPRR